MKHKAFQIELDKFLRNQPYLRADEKIYKELKRHFDLAANENQVLILAYFKKNPLDNSKINIGYFGKLLLFIEYLAKNKVSINETIYGFLKGQLNKQSEWSEPEYYSKILDVLFLTLTEGSDEEKTLNDELFIFQKAAGGGSVVKLGFEDGSAKVRFCGQLISGAFIDHTFFPYIFSNFRPLILQIEKIRGEK